MKKNIIKTVAAVLCLTALMSENVFASNFGVKLSGETNFTTSTTITVAISGNDNVDQTFGGIGVITANLVYDATKINVETAAAGGFSLTKGTQLVLDRAEGVADGTPFLSMTVTNISLTDGETTTITLSNIVGSDFSNDILASNVSVTIKYVAPAPVIEEEKVDDKKEETSTTNTNNTNNAGAQPIQKQTTVENVVEEKAEESTESEEENEEAPVELVETKKEESVTTENNGEQKSGPNVVVIILITLAILTIGVGAVSFAIKNRKQKTTKRRKKF